MKKILKSRAILFLAFLVFYLIVEITTSLWVDFDILPDDTLMNIVLIFAISSVIFLFKSIKAAIVYLSFFFVVFLLLFVVNATMYDVYYDLFTIQQLKLIGEAANVIEFEHISFLSIGIAIAYFVIYFFVMKYIYKNIEKSNKLSYKAYYSKAILCLLFSIIFVIGFFNLKIDKIVEYTSNDNVTAFKRTSFSKYGIVGFYMKEVENLINDEDTCDISLYTKSKETEYFGLLEDKNVITILLESVQPFAINEVLTPNLYMLQEQGLNFENSYSENKTNFSELIGIVGNYPMTPVSFTSNTYDFSYGMPMILKDLGYQTTYLHDNVSTFYARGLLMPNLGFENIYLHEELYPGQDIWRWNGDYTLDSFTMQEMLPYISSENEPFYSYWATLSTHGPYNYGPTNKRLFEQYGYFDAIDEAEADGLWVNELAGGEEVDVLRMRHYQAAVMDLDKAIGMLLDDLESKGILDDTILVLYGDHNVYYHEIYLKRFPENNDISNMEMYKNYFVIYNPTLSSKYLEISNDDDTTISKFVSPYNIVPTLYDLLGIHYDINMFIGSSIFEDKNEVFYSLKMTSFFDNNFFSDDGVEIIYNKNNLEDPIIGFQRECEEIRNKIDYINKHYICTKVSRDELIQ